MTSDNTISWIYVPKRTNQKFSTLELNKIHGKNDYTAPDKSHIRKFQDARYGGFAHCELAPGLTSEAQKHCTVDEIWYCIRGKGEIWCKQGMKTRTVKVRPEVCITIPLGTHFQFRNKGNEPLIFVIATMPPWPGPSEAIRVEDHWKVKWK